jgi:hypothetical protein
MKRTNPFIIPLTMLLVGIALDSFAGCATLSKPRERPVAQRELPASGAPDKPWQDWSWTWQPWKLIMWSYQPGDQ